MEIEPLALDGALLIRGRRFGDPRGWFEETWSQPSLAAAGFHESFVQDNLSWSAEPGTLRGLHCQLSPSAQGKLVGVVTGAIRDVIVDLREGSPSFGRHVCVELSEEDPVRLWAPPGFLHGFLTLSPDTRVAYKVTSAYDGARDCSIAWNDPDLAIDWGVDQPILSDKDAAAPRLAQAGVLFAQGSV